MSTIPDRTISGISRLVKANRTAPDPTPIAEAPTPAAAETSPSSAPTSPAPPAPPQRAKHTITIYIPADVRQQARAAYRATSTLEADDSFSDMIAKAIAAETTRRQNLYNDGRPFTADPTPLPTGRRLSADP